MRWSGTESRTLLLATLAISLGCGLETRIAVRVPREGATSCGELRFASEEKPPYPPTAEVDEDRLREGLREAARANGIPPAGVDAEVERLMRILEEPTTYGVVAVGGFISEQTNDAPRVRCPRFVQLVRSRFRVRGSVTLDHGFAAVASMSPWTQTGGTPTAEGWCVDRVQQGTNPVFGDDDLPGVFQHWSSGTARMVDVPGVSQPWVSNSPGDVISTWFEFQTWLLAPCAEAEQIADGLIDELLGAAGGGAGGAPATRLPCETFPNQPQRALRVPVGRVEWGFKVEVSVGADADGTSAQTSGSYYRWILGGPAAASPYVELMTANYADWVPP